MRAIHKRAEVVGRTVKMRWRKEGGSVVSPSELTWKFGDGHDFEQSDFTLHEFRQQFASRAPGSFSRKRSDVHFGNELSLQSHAFPRLVFPAIQKWIHDL